MTRINGQERPEAAGLTLAKFLEANGYKASLVACESNGCIVARSCFENHVIDADEILEIVRFVGGG